MVIPNTLHKSIINRLHYYHHGISNMFAAAKDLEYLNIHRNIASIAKNFRECILAVKKLESMCTKGDISEIPEPREPNEAAQLDFWSPINYLKESKKYVIAAVDRFSRCSLAMICNTFRADKILKLLKSYISNLWVP